MAKTTPLCKPHKIFISYGQTKAVPHPTLGIKAKTYLYYVTEFFKKNFHYTSDMKLTARLYKEPQKSHTKGGGDHPINKCANNKFNF